jgi:EPS-associated MarR family transcriptional regulator
MLSDEIRLQILRELERDPELSQRELAENLGVSVGKTNYCLRALVDMGLVKVRNFRRSGNKMAYAYQLTPRGIADKASVTKQFLKIKLQEYDALQKEIEELRNEVSRRETTSNSEPNSR